MRLMAWTAILSVLACTHGRDLAGAQVSKPGEDVSSPVEVTRLLGNVQSRQTNPAGEAGCEDRTIFKLTASAYPEANQTVVATMTSKTCELSKAPILTGDDVENPERYSWEAYRLVSSIKTGRSQSTYIGRAFLFEKNHLLIRLNPDKRSLASDTNFLPYDRQNRVILLFVEKGERTLMDADFETIFDKAQAYDEALIKKIKFLAKPVETGIQRFNAAAD